MKWIFSKKYWQRGSALAFAMAVLMFMMFIGMGLLAMSQQNLRQGSAVVKMDKQYYSAESAAQLAAQIFMQKLDERYLDDEDNKIYLYKETTDLIVDPDINTLKSAFESEARQNLQKLYEEEIVDKIADLINGINPDGESVEFNGELGFMEFDIGGDYEDVKDEIGNETYTAAVYLDNPKFSIIAVSGTRTATIEIEIKTTFNIDSTESEVVFPLSYGAYYQDKTGGVYGSTGSVDKYGEYKAGLDELLADADADYAKYKIESNVVDESALPAASNYNWDNAVNAQYINSWGTVTLGKAGQTTTYPNLEYIKSGSSLEIKGTFYCPSLESLYMRSGNMTIKAGAKINPMEVDGSGKVINQNKPYSGSCNFYGDTVLYVNCSTEINWCRFNIKEISVNYGNGGKLTSNSIFISREWVKLSGTASTDTSRVIPQFYMRGYMAIGADVETLAGIFMTPSDNKIINNGNDPNKPFEVVGLFVGNADVGWQNKPLTPKDPNEPVKTFDPDTLLDLMDGAWLLQYMQDGDSVVVETTDAEVQFDYTAKAARIYEAANERS